MKYLSLFSGIGGFELGLENAEREFECIGYSEIDSFAKAIYSRWFPEHTNLGDASKIDPRNLEDFDLLVGGFPCQAFSLSGYRRGFEDTRGTLFFEIARICEEKRPRYLLLENVKGLLSHQKGETFEKMLGVLAELGYDVEWEVLNSKDFRTAQNRERVYIKGYSRAKCGGEILSQKRVSRETTVQGIDLLVPNKQATRIMGVEGTSSTLCGLGEGQGGKTGLYAVPRECKPYKFERQVKKRVHEVDLDELCIFLRNHKENAKLSVRSISESLDRPVSEVEHWFRKDKYFAPPSADVWNSLKELLDIKNDKYDAYITEFEYVDGVFEQDKKAYGEEGLSQTLTTNPESLIKINVVGNLSRTGHNGENVLGTDGLASTLTPTNYKHPLRIKTNTNKGYDEVVDGDGVRLCHPTSKLARGRTQKGQTGALSTKADWGTLDKDFRIRRLTPKECERLQAFPDDWTKYDCDGNLVSDTQRYKCLGNAVTTTVVTHVANEMFNVS